MKKINLVLLLVLAILVPITACKHKQKPKQQQVKAHKVTVPLGEYHTFSLTKFEKPQQFSFLISCQQKAYINFELSKRLKTLHHHLYLDIDFETDECIETHQDQNRIILSDQSWDLSLENVCCAGKNKSKIFNQTIKVIVRDGFKIFGVPVKTKLWNSLMPIVTSFVICLFVWFSNFSQPRADNVSFLSRFYKETKPIQSHGEHLDISIDKVEQNNPSSACKNKQQ